MTPARGIASTWLAACVAAMLFFAPCAGAMTLVPPELLAIAFESRTARLTAEGLQTVDRLAVRAAQCPATGLVVRVRPARGADKVVTQRRIAAVRARLAGLGLELRVVQGPLTRSWSSQDRNPDAHVLNAEVSAGSDVWCHPRQGSQIFEWARQLGRHVEGVAPEMPVFWQQMSASVRLLELARPLAKAAYCDGALTCDRHPALYTWLAEQALPKASADIRRDWFFALWTMAGDAEVEAFRSRWSLSPLTVEERVEGADRLASSGLPWATIEHRLMAPGLMPLFASRPMVGGGPGPQALLAAAVRRGELESFDRLVEAAGPAKACLVTDAFRRAVGLAEEFEALRAHFGNWSRGMSVPYQEDDLDDLSCNPAGWVLLECNLAQGDEADRVAVIWQALRQAGVTTTSPAIQALKARRVDVDRLQCEPPSMRRAPTIR